jgi:hypothetical protein
LITLIKPVLAQQTIESVKVKIPLNIDGKLDGPAWQEANKFSGFKTMHPKASQSPSESTKVYLEYDQTNIYVGIQC